MCDLLSICPRWRADVSLIPVSFRQEQPWTRTLKFLSGHTHKWVLQRRYLDEQIRKSRAVQDQITNAAKPPRTVRDGRRKGSKVLARIDRIVLTTQKTKVCVKIVH